jgi:hypothetical protein
MPTTGTLAHPVTFSHSGAWPSHFVNQNKIADNFAPYSLNDAGIRPVGVILGHMRGIAVKHLRDNPED